MPQADDDSKQIPLFLLHVLRRNWLWLVFFALVGGCVSAFYSLGQTKIYSASTTIQIDPHPPSPLGPDIQNVVDVGAGMFWDIQQYYRTQYEVLRSRKLATDTVRRLGLHNDVTFILNKPPDYVLPPDAPGPSEDAAQAAVQSRLSVNAIKESRLVQVSFTDADPARAERVLRTLVELYIDNNVDSVLESTENAAEWLNVQLTKLRSELDDREIALHEYKRANQLLSVSIDDQNNLLREEINQLSNALTRVQTEIENLVARHEQIRKLEITDPAHLPSTEFLNSPVITSLRSQWVNAKATREELSRSGRGEQHPSVLANQALVDELATALKHEISNIRLALQAELETKRREEAGLKRLHGRATTRALDLNALGLEYRRLERARENTERLYSVVLERTKESDLTRFMRFNNIRVLDEAKAGAGPVYPRTPVNVAFGVMLGLGAGLLLALGRSYFDRTFRNPGEVEEMLQTPILAVLPRAEPIRRSARTSSRRRPGLTNELLVHEKPSSNIAEAARALRTNLTFSAPDKPLKKVLITSGGPHEGKTTVACWIATALAQTGKRVLLMDCDLRKPRMHKVFERTNETGLTTALLEPSLLDELKLETQVPNLSLLVAGPSVPNPSELLHSERFSKFLKSLEQRYDCIVIDSPPVAAVTDATILSTLVDGTLLVVRAHATYRELARQAMRMLRDVSTSTLGVVLNATDFDRGGYGNYRYHYYYYSNNNTN